MCLLSFTSLHWWQCIRSQFSTWKGNSWFLVHLASVSHMLWGLQNSHRRHTQKLSLFGACQHLRALQGWTLPRPLQPQELMQSGFKRDCPLLAPPLPPPLPPLPKGKFPMFYTAGSPLSLHSPVINGFFEVTYLCSCKSNDLPQPKLVLWRDCEWLQLPANLVDWIASPFSSWHHRMLAHWDTFTSISKVSWDVNIMVSLLAILGPEIYSWATGFGKDKTWWYTQIGWVGHLLYGAICRLYNPVVPRNCGVLHHRWIQIMADMAYSAQLIELVLDEVYQKGWCICYTYLGYCDTKWHCLCRRISRLGPRPAGLTSNSCPPRLHLLQKLHLLRS